MSVPARSKKLVVVLKGYPRLSETFIAQELLGLEKAGVDLLLVSLRHPTDTSRHAVHDEIKAPVLYLPEYLHKSPWRVLLALINSVKKPGFKRTFRSFCADFKRDRTRNRIRRFGQAMVLSSEWPESGQWLHAHFIHTPASVAAYTSSLRAVPWTVSAHAKDIWTSPDWELREKLNTARWAVTCTRVGYKHLQSLAADDSCVHLSYHGLDLERFPEYQRQNTTLDGRQTHTPVTILSVGRAVKKKGFDVLLESLAQLPEELHWRFVHIGGGAELAKLQQRAETLKIAHRITWLGAINQREVLSWYRSADVFALACRITQDGDRDGLPNVLVEAASQGLACVSTTISGIPELFVDEQNGLLVDSENAHVMMQALHRLICEPHTRVRLGRAAQMQVRATFDYHNSIRQLLGLFESQWQGLEP